jgi:glycine hydroxymethyltransferase
VILCKSQWAKAVDHAIFPGLQGGPLMHIVAGKAVAFAEALQPSFKKYAADIVANAKALADELTAKGWRLVSGGTDNHLMLVDLRSRDVSKNLTGHDGARFLASAGIIANKNTIPFDTRPPIQSSGIRLGTPALTSRGMGIEQMKTIAGWIDQILTSDGDQGLCAKIRKTVSEFCKQFPIRSVI